MNSRGDLRRDSKGFTCITTPMAPSTFWSSREIDPLMATRRLKRPRDPAQLAKLIVDIATGQVEDHTTDDGKSSTAVARGRLGGEKGGRARAQAMSASERKRI